MPFSSSSYSGAPRLGQAAFARFLRDNGFRAPRQTVINAIRFNAYGDTYDADSKEFIMPAAVEKWIEYKARSGNRMLSRQSKNKKKLNPAGEETPTTPGGEPMDVLERINLARLDTEALKAWKESGRLADVDLVSRRFGTLVRQLIGVIREIPTRHAAKLTSKFGCHHGDALSLLQSIADEDIGYIKGMDLVEKFAEDIAHAAETGAKK